MRNLTAVIHGFSGVGKSWLGDTVPAPRLILDAEGGADFTPSGPKIEWDPLRSEPPVADGTWQTCIVRVRDFGTIRRVFEYLNSGMHPFESVVLDSLTEIQKRCLDQVVGTNAPQQQDWGTLLRYMEALVRSFRDLKMHPVKPLKAVLFICISSERGKDGQISPHVQGQLRDTLTQFVDVVGYMYTEMGEDGSLHRKMLIQPWSGFVAKDRMNLLTSKYGFVLTNGQANLTDWLQIINAPSAQEVTV